MPQLVEDLGKAITPILNSPFIFFGHSLGALLAFELTLWLRRRGNLVPQHLFVSGRRAPHVPSTEPWTWEQPDDQFVQTLADLKGTPPDILADRDLLELLLPTIRADFRLAETYLYTPEAPLSCPITVFGGTDDEESLGDRLRAWREHTFAPCTVTLFEGDHFFIQSKEQEVLTRMREELSVNVRKH